MRIPLQIAYSFDLLWCVHAHGLARRSHWGACFCLRLLGRWPPTWKRWRPPASIQHREGSLRLPLAQQALQAPLLLKLIASRHSRSGGEEVQTDEERLGGRGGAGGFWEGSFQKVAVMVFCPLSDSQ